MRIRVWFDYVCPWCYLALDRSAYLAVHHRCTVEWLPYELYPGTPPEGIGLDGRLLAGHRDLRAELTEAGLRIGSIDSLVNSRGALAISRAASGQPGWETLHRSLFAAYLIEGRNLADRAVLEAIVGESDVELELGSVLDRAAETITASMETAWTLGIGGTPGWQFDDGPVLVGAHPRSVFDRVIARFDRTGQTARGG